ncbi:UvrD-helicase domain-containing protein [Cyanobacterium aponinum FACHB-4101]|uniref:UvrD-helicase domain-containing protein n=1 Tax=Cyanobacterium aponinum TaxID=379064 RepID=UPI001681A6E0|nr:UvrD-helicase domain-containing protein [Cyanobacterium aponinum FACHB-4101]
MTIPILFSVRVWNKIRALSPKERSRFLFKVRRITHNSIPYRQIRELKINSSLKIFRIRYNLNYRIIATLLRDNQDNSVIKIVDFIPHDDLDRGKFPIDGIGEYSVEDIENLSHEELEENLVQEHLWRDNNLSINYSYFTHQESDFFSFTINPESQTDPDLILSSQQYQIIKQQPNLPTLLTGSAGSGKTSIALYLALHNAHNQKNDQSSYQVLYVTYNRSLTNYAENIIKRIYPEKLDNFINIDYHNLCKKFIDDHKIGFILHPVILYLIDLLPEKKHKKRYEFEFISAVKFYQFLLLNFDHFLIRNPFLFIRENKVNLYRFINEFYQTRTTRVKELNPVSLWEEIRHLLKGSIESINSENHLISYEEYKKLTKQSVLSPDINYQEVYQLVTNYQNWLESNEYWDELDYTHYLLKQIPKNYKGEYHEIYCDEIQDLTQIQVKFLLRLLILNNDGYSLPKIFFTGDPAQTINPSGFSWNKIKNNIYQSYQNYYQINQINKQIEPKHLTINFRSYSGIVNLGSAIVNIIRENSNHQSELIKQETWLESEIKPFILKESPEQIFQEKASFGLKNAIIVSDENEKERLASYFPQDSERILTIQEVKGLEFDEVLIWNFFTGFDSWQNRNNQAIRELNNFKYNCLYVCITRARNKLYFYDQQTIDFWNQPEIKNLVTQGNLDELETIFASYESLDKMREAAEDYVNEGNEKSYKIAIQIYETIKDEKEINRVKALLSELQEDWENAGEYWDKINDFVNAFRCWAEINNNLWQKKWGYLAEEEWNLRGDYFYRENDFAMAIYCYQQSNNKEKEIDCLEKLNQWELAGDKLKEMGREIDAFHNYELANEYYQENQQLDKSAQMWTKLEEWKKASPLWESLQEWDKAGECWQKAEEFELSALCWEKVEAWDKAEKCWQKLENWKKVAICCQNQGKWRSSARNWLKIEDKNKAAYCYQQANDLDKAMELWQESESWHQVAIALELEQRYSEAAKIWAKVNPLQQKALCHEKCEEWEEAEKCWRELGNWHQVALMCEKQDKWLESAKIWEKEKEWQKSASAWLQINEIEKAAICYENGGYWQDAEYYWRELGNWHKIALMCEKQDKWLESAKIWEKEKEWRKSASAWLRINEVEKAAICYENGGYWQDAEKCWENLQQWQKVAQCLENQFRWNEAGEKWLEIKEKKKAAICFENDKNWMKAEKCWTDLEDWEKVAKCLRNQRKFWEEAQIWLTIGNIEKSGKAYENGQYWEDAELCWRKLERWEEVAKCLEKQSKLEEAGKIYEKILNLYKAGECYDRCQKWEKAESCWRQVKNWERIGNACENQGKHKWQEAAEAYQNAGCNLKSAELWLKLGFRRKAIWVAGQKKLF